MQHTHLQFLFIARIICVIKHCLKQSPEVYHHDLCLSFTSLRSCPLVGHIQICLYYNSTVSQIQRHCPFSIQHFNSQSVFSDFMIILQDHSPVSNCLLWFPADAHWLGQSFRYVQGESSGTQLRFANTEKPSAVPLGSRLSCTLSVTERVCQSFSCSTGVVDQHLFAISNYNGS